MPTLFIRMLSQATRDDEGFRLRNEWLISEDDGSVRAKGATDLRGLEELIDPEVDWLHDPGNIVVILPGEHVLGVNCEVPGRSVGQIRRALPFVVEEFVATDIEGMHLASGPIRRGESIRCNLIDRALLDDWLECLGEVGLPPGHMVSEAELLPAEPGQVSVLFEADTVLLKTTDQAATVDRSNLLLALGSVAAEEILLINGTLNDLEMSQLDGDVRLRTTGDAPVETTLGYLATRWLEQPDTINLLQGPYVPPRQTHTGTTRWYAVAGLAGAWLLIGAITMIVQGFWASTQADQLEAASEQLFRDIFPGERRVRNVRRQMQAQLGGRSGNVGGGGFTSYLADLGAVLNSNAVITSLNYTDARGELAADLLLRGYEELDQLKENLEQRGLDVAITSAEQVDGGVRARIRIGGVQGA
ncbi:MAG: type II secretion system protein GspL [Pseudomonadales bacterium]